MYKMEFSKISAQKEDPSVWRDKTQNRGLEGTGRVFESLL